MLMEEEIICGCKGIRSCLLCEPSIKKRIVYDKSHYSYASQSPDHNRYTYCSSCAKAFLGDNNSHPKHGNVSIPFSGINIIPNFISQQEEDSLVDDIYLSPFTPSQSGRRKQDYGPKVNFKRRKLCSAMFTGLPSYSKYLFRRMLNVEALSDFVPIELCNLEYAAERGSSIDFHFDDFWLWGDRLVTLNLLSDSVLSFVSDLNPHIEIDVLLPRRSLMVVSGESRYLWKHGIHRQCIHGYRVAMTWRELSAEFMYGGERCSEGEQLTKMALSFVGLPVI